MVFPMQDLVRLALCNPQNLASLTLKEWDVLIQHGRKAAMLGKIHALLDESNLLHQIPSAPRAHLEAAHILACDQERVIRWEVYRIQRALARVVPNFVLLKGAAYVLSRLPIARGRVQSDIDILVPKSKLIAAETALLENGWKHVKLKKYDQRYYRKWSHELPPMYHSERGTVIDVHHNILPETGRLHPNPNKLLERAESINGSAYRRLCPVDMILHSAAHLFQDGDFHQGLRELADVDGLLRFFSAQRSFWAELLQRAPEMDLDRPLFYALRYSSRFLQTPIPDFLVSAAQAWQPQNLLLKAMDHLVYQALMPQNTHTRLATESARWLLYVRSHWLRMPPLLLSRHLLYKAFKNRLST
jgi:hypothetical protein